MNNQNLHKVDTSIFINDELLGAIKDFYKAPNANQDEIDEIIRKVAQYEFRQHVEWIVRSAADRKRDLKKE